MGPFRAGVVRRLPIDGVVASTALAAMAALPIAEIVLRRSAGIGVPGSILIVQHLTLIVTFLGAGLAARSGGLLALSTAGFLQGHAGRTAEAVASVAGTLVSAALAAASLQYVNTEYAAGSELVLGVPLWVVVAVMPIAYTTIGVALAARLPVWCRLALLVGAVPFFLSTDGWSPALRLPGLALLAAGTVCGLPIFATLGGAALVLFATSGTPPASVAVNSYALSSFPVLPAVPLFALAGTLLTAGRSSDRLVALLNALVGWLPGGAAIAATLAFAFLTSFTGASGVTILSLGGLMVPALVKAGYREEFAIGLVTSAGSIGLLLPPSVPVMLYGVYAQHRIDHLFLGGVVPGTLLVALVAALGAWHGYRAAVARRPFDVREVGRAIRAAQWELALPVIVLAALLSGIATMVETAALTVCYLLAVGTLVHREISIARDLPRILLESARLIGGFLIVLAVALALTDFVTFEGIPTRALALVEAHIRSPLVFLLALNLFLIVVGALMDIYSAIFVVVPLVAPMAAAYGIHPVHLGVIFLANLELGYLTPPMGENLFLSASRFSLPVTRIFRCAWPFYLVLGLGVAAVTYVPWLTLAALHLFGS